MKRGDDGGPSPRRRELAELLCQALEAPFIDLSTNLLKTVKTSLRRWVVSYVPDGLSRLGAEVKWFHDSLVLARPSPPADADLKGRIRHAERFWHEINVMAPSRCVGPEFASLLPRLDAFCPPHDRWPKRPETARGARIRVILENVLTGSLTSAANPWSQRFALDILGRDDLLITVASEGSPVSVLMSMAADGNLLEDLQQAYYDVRAKLFEDPGLRDLVDLSVILAAACCVDRWVLTNVPLDRVIDTLIAEDQLAGLA